MPARGWKGWKGTWGVLLHKWRSAAPSLCLGPQTRSPHASSVLSGAEGISPPQIQRSGVYLLPRAVLVFLCIFFKLPQAIVFSCKICPSPSTGSRRCFGISQALPSPSPSRFYFFFLPEGEFLNSTLNVYMITENN